VYNLYAFKLKLQQKNWISLYISNNSV